MFTSVQWNVCVLRCLNAYVLYVHILGWSHAHMSTCFDDHMFCWSYAPMPMCFNDHMPACLFVRLIALAILLKC